MELYKIASFNKYLLGKEGDNDWSVWRIKKSGELKKLKGGIDDSGHILYNLSICGKHATKYLHVLIAELFIPIPQELLDSEEKLDVHHIDGNPQNNSISNLVWLTHSEHRRLHTLGKHHSEESKRKMSKQVYQYSLDGELVAAWPSTQECGRNGFNHGAVVNCCNGKRKQYKGFKWSYEAPPKPKITQTLYSSKFCTYSPHRP